MIEAGIERPGPRHGHWLPGPVIGVLTVVAMTFALLIVVIPFILPAAILKILLPMPRVRRVLDRFISWLAGVAWVGQNHLIFAALHGRRHNISITGDLDIDRSWLIVANHQSWADILILFDVFYRRIGFPRFFMKDSLIWIPVVGFVCWALDMPFMKRTTPEAIARNPALRDVDLETTRRFCGKFRGRPIAVVNFLEGTRFTPVKALAKQSPYRHLLRPKSAGFSFTLNAMGGQFAGMIDTTLVYQPTTPGRSKLWSFLCGEQSGASVQARVRPLPPDVITGDYQDDAAFRARFQHWVNGVWAEKDEAIEARLDGRGQ